MRGGTARHGRNGLLATTALQAVGAAMLMAAPAAAQPAPGAHPVGGSVVAGQAGISQTAAQTTVAQSSQRAAIDWRSFDIGSSHAVVFQQPNASSITLNRVTGPDPSQIAGRIQANGQVAIVNRSGVVFHAGSQVDVQSLVVSSANVSNVNFMAGRMVFDQPGRPDARISNAGSISVRAAGLAALVAPQVANSGTITARMGHVVLAGGEAHTVDLYGDGLMSVDVTKQVQRAPNGATVLVTNSGAVAADGGTIVLTAKAADGIMTNLVSSTGRLQANSIGGNPGAITVSALGGSISIAGAVRADGQAPGTTGGTVTLAATDTVAVASTARVSADGHAGGGTVAVGTTAARALAQATPGGGGIPARTARVVTVAAGARIGASGRETGSGGTVALLSTDSTTMAGGISVGGGRQGGNGGQVEVSGRAGLSITGTVDARAPAGWTGTLTIDPTTLVIGNVTADVPQGPAADGAGAPATGTQNITAATFNGFGATVRLTGGDITVGDSRNVIGTAAGSVTLQATGTLLVTGLGITQPGPLTLAGNTTVNIQAPVSATGALTLSSGGPILILAPVTTPGTLTLTGATIGQGATGYVTAGTLTGSAASVSLPAATDGTPGQQGNQVATLGSLTATAGGLTLRDSRNLLVTGPVSATGDVAITVQSGAGTPSVAAGQAAGNLTLLDRTPSTSLASTSVASASVASASVASTGVASTGGQVTLTAFGTLAGSGVSAPTQVGLFAGGDVRVAGITTGTLTGTAGGVFQASGAFAGASSVVATGGNLTLTDTVPLTLAGASSTPGDAVVAAPSLASSGDLFAGGSVDLQLPSGTFTQSAGTIAARVKLSVAADTAPGSAASSITQSGGLLAAGGDLVLHSTGDATQTGGELAGQFVRIVSDGGTSSFGATRSATVTLTPGSPVLGVLPAFTAPIANACLGTCVAGGPAAPATFRVDAGAISLSNPVTAGVVELHSLGSTAQTAAGIITAGSLVGTAGYSQGAGFTYDAPLTQPGSVVLTAQNSVASLGPYYAGGDFRLASTRSLTVAGQVVAGGVDPVPGVGRTIALTAPGIVIGGLEGGGLLQFGTLQGGRFSAAPSASALLPGGPATATAYSTVNLQADSLQLLGASPRVIAPGGLVAIAPLTPGLALSVDASRLDVPGSVMSLAAADLSRVSVLGGTADAGGPRTLQLGSLAGGAGAPAAGAVTINAPLVLTDQAATLGLYSQGAIAEGAAAGISIGRAGFTGSDGSPQVIGTITGAAGGAVALGATSDTASGNHFDVLGPFSAGRGLTVSDAPDANSGQAGLLVQGTVSSGAGDLGLLSVGRVLPGGEGPGVRLGGTIAIGSAAVPGVLNAVDGSGAGHTLTLVARDGVANAPAITEAAGSTIKAGVLTGRASTADTSATAYDVVLPGTGAAPGSSGTNQVATLGGFTVGTGTAAAQGAFRLAGAGPLTVAGPVTAKSVQVTTSTMTVTGSIGACNVGEATGDVVLTAPGGLTVGGGVIGGQTRVALLADTTVAGGIVNGPSVTVGGRLALTGGQVIGNTVTLGGAATIGADGSGGSATPGTGALQAGSLLLAPGVVILFNSGALASGGDLTVAAAPAISGSIATAGSLVVQSANPAAPVLTSSAILLANAGLTVNAAQGFTQADGTIAAGQGVTINAGGVINQGAGAAMQAGGTLLLHGQGAGTAILAGALSGEPVQFIQPNADLMLTPSALSGRATVSVGQPRITLSCPGCDNSAPLFGAAPAVSLDAPHGSGARRPASLLADGGGVVLGTVAADIVEVHAGGSASQAAGATLTAGALTGTAGYAPGGTDPASGLPTYATLGTAGTGSLMFAASGNNVLNLSGIQARSGLVLADTPAGQTTSTGASMAAAGLTVGTTVRAGLATDPLTGTTADATDAQLTITLAGPAGNLAIGGARAPGAVLAGGAVTLSMPGTLTQAPDALLVAGTLGGGSASASLAPAVGNQVVRLGTFSAAGDLNLVNARDLQVSGAVQAGGTVALTASGAVTETTGAIRANTLSINADSVDARSGQNAIAVLSGVVAPGGVQLVDGQSLVTSGAVTAASGPVVLQAGGDLTVGSAVTAGGAMTLQGNRLTLAPGSSTMAGTAMLLNAGSVATLAGQVAAPRLVVTAPQIALQGGTLTVGGTVQAGRTAVGLPAVGDGGNGAFFEAASGLTQSGQTGVLPAGASQATVRIDLTSGTGRIVFAGLDAPSTNLTLNLGSGSVSGQVNLNNLSVLFSTRPGTVALFGTVGTQGGKQAAGASAIGPSLNQGYQINGCEIGSATCAALNPNAAPVFNPLLTLDLDFFRSGVPVTNPLKELRLNFFRDQDDDRDLLIPNITEQGL